MQTPADAVLASTDASAHFNRSGQDGPPMPGGRVAVNRKRRTQAFLDAALHIVAEDGLESLTMTRLALELDTAISAAYRYFPSKSHLVAEVQKVAIQRLTASIDLSIDPVVDAVGTRADRRLVRLVVVGRWFVSVRDIYPEELKLLEMIMSLSNPTLEFESGLEVLPPAMGLLQRVGTAIEAAADAGVIRKGVSLDRSIIWAACLSGVSQTQKLERFAPDLFAPGRLTRRTSLDLLAGWGADPDVLARIEKSIDKVELRTPIARAQPVAATPDA